MNAALFLIALFFFAQSHAQTKSEHSSHELSWNEFYKLRWDDFGGQPDEQAKGDAATAVAIRAKPFLVKKKVHYDVVAIFNRRKSWVRDTSPSLLAHEQLHFDIAEWYARKIRRKIAELKAEGVNDIAVLDKAVRQLLLESNAVDEQYDLETLHGALSKKQEFWSRKVADELEALEAYRKVRRFIGG